MASIKDLAQCTSKCRSKRHALEMISAVTKGTLSQVKVYLQCCYNSTSGLTDPFGRNLLHVAASCGKADIVEWLLQDRKFKPSTRDSESNWTALHRALFYGQLAAARILASHVNPCLYMLDKEGLSPLDLVMKDRPAYIDYADSSLCETFSWGDNTNFTLGHSIQQQKAYPEAIDSFRREKINIVEVIICKFHTVFLTKEGQVYTCGHGRGGRLGHGTEQTCVVPCLVEGLKQEKVKAIAAAMDHTLFLTESKSVYACGLNHNRLLGLAPAPEICLSPKQMKTKFPKGQEILGISAGRFHSILYTRSAVYSFGLNAGQLGHHKGDVYQTAPRQVSALNQKDVIISHVACSDAATVCLTTKGDIFVLHEYRCRKIASRTLEIIKVCVSGGNLDHTCRSDTDILRERGGKQLVIAILTEGGKVFIWKESYQTLLRVNWNLGRDLEVRDFTLNPVSIGIVSNNGEVFLAKPKPSHTKSQTPSKAMTTKESPTDNFGATSLLDLLEKEETDEYQVQRVPYIHWGLKIASDRKGRNYVVMQGQPISNLTNVPEIQSSKIRHHFNVLLEDSDEFDTIHDVVLQVGPRKITGHKYILAHQCDYFRKLFLQSEIGATSESPHHQVVEISDVNVELFTQLVRFLYTDDCDLLHIGEAYSLPKDSLSEDTDEDYSEFILVSSSKKMSAYQVQQQKQGKCAEGLKSEKKAAHNPVRMLQEMAKTFGVKALIKRLEAIKYVQGKIQSNGKHLAKPDLRFDRKKLLALSDVVLQSEDGKTIACHKCILCARLEYFHSMLGSGWIETSALDSLPLPVAGNVLQIIVDYIYTDTANVIQACEVTEFICNVLVVADQLLIMRLKEICEAAITQMLTLKNAAELLEFSTIYNAAQLKTACQEYICINLATMVESRYLDVLSEEVIAELTKFYKEFVPAMSRRVLTPYADPPDIATLESLDTDVEVESLQWQASTDGPAKKGKSKRRRSRNKSVSEDKGGRERKLSVASDVSLEEYSSEPTSPRSDIEQPLLMEVESFDPQDVFSQESLMDELPSPKSPFVWCAVSGDATGAVGAWRNVPLPQVPDLSSPLLSPTSPSLKEIMIAEETKEVVAKKHQTSSGKKKRKQLFRPISLDSSQPTSMDDRPSAAEKGTTSPATPAACPWASSTNSMVQSLRDLMIDEEKQANAKITAPNPEKQRGKVTAPNPEKQRAKVTAPNPEKQRVKVTSPSGLGDASLMWGLPTSKRKQKPQKDVPMSPESPDPPCSPRENPWQTRPTPGPGSKVVSFEQIIKDQAEQRQSLDKASKKPLHLIQIEEQAIQELLAHYKADDNMDKYISVERVAQAMATPTWVTHQKTPKI